MYELTISAALFIWCGGLSAAAAYYIWREL